MFMIGAFVLALVMTLITFMVIRRIVIRPLQHAAQRIEKIASGDLTMNDEPAGRNQIGRLNRHLQQMQHSLGMTVGTVRQGRKRFIVAPAKFQLAMRTCHLAPKNKRRLSNKLPLAWSNSLRR
ncbi:HAMP domain-containing protein [Escherichia coli]